MGKLVSNSRARQPYVVPFYLGIQFRRKIVILPYGNFIDFLHSPTFSDSFDVKHWMSKLDIFPFADEILEWFQEVGKKKIVFKKTTLLKVWKQKKQLRNALRIWKHLKSRISICLFPFFYLLLCTLSLFVIFSLFPRV